MLLAFACPCLADRRRELGQRLVGVELVDQPVELVNLGIALRHCFARPAAGFKHGNTREFRIMLGESTVKKARIG